MKNYNPQTVAILCGPGNNGGDGFVAARYLSKNCKVTIVLLSDEKKIRSAIAKENFKKLMKLNIPVYTGTKRVDTEKILDETDVIIDAMLGVGISGELRNPYAALVKKLNNFHNKTILSIDTPTGLGTNQMLKPSATITFHDIKKGMNTKNSGKIIVTDIGIPKFASEYVGPGELNVYYPKSKTDSHKGDNGKLLVIGGGPYIGAPALAGLAAMRTGVDLAYIAAPRRVSRAITSFSPQFIKPKRQAQTMAKLSPNLIIQELSNENMFVSDDLPLIKKLLLKCDTMVIGPGLGNHKKTQTAVREAVKAGIQHHKSLVIDADAIGVIGKQLNLIRNSPTIITPHTGEFKELTNQKLSTNLNERRTLVKTWAKKLGITILLKGPVDIISDGQQIKLNEVHNPGMTVGGTGDVLSGIVGALLAKGLTPFNAAKTGAFINGAAGNEAFKQKSFGMLATDIIEEIPHTLVKSL